MSWKMTKTYSLGVDSTGSNVERELSLRDSHSSDSEVTESENPRTVGNDADLHLVMGKTGLEVGDDLGELLLVVLGEVKGTDRAVVLRRRRVDEGPVLARGTDDGAVSE
jgi:hypothetical protein